MGNWKRKIERGQKWSVGRSPNWTMSKGHSLLHNPYQLKKRYRNFMGRVNFWHDLHGGIKCGRVWRLLLPWLHTFRSQTGASSSPEDISKAPFSPALVSRSRYSGAAQTLSFWGNGMEFCWAAPPGLPQPFSLSLPAQAELFMEPRLQVYPLALSVFISATWAWQSRQREHGTRIKCCKVLFLEVSFLCILTSFTHSRSV